MMDAELEAMYRHGIMTVKDFRERNHAAWEAVNRIAHRGPHDREYRAWVREARERTEDLDTVIRWEEERMKDLADLVGFPSGELVFRKPSEC
jgi:hypothetical protein